MHTNNLTKISVAIVLATTTSSAMAAGEVVDKTGEALSSFSDNLYSKLTGKKVNNIAVNHPVSLYDYSEGSSSYEDAYLNGSLNVSDTKDTHTNYVLNTSVDYEKLTATPNANIKYDAKLNANISDAGGESERQENYSGSASATYDKYFNPASDAFWYGKGELSVTEEGPTDYAGLSNPEVIVSGGLGYGRVINVTPMAQTMRLVESLIGTGVLSQAPSKAVYKNIANIIDKKDEYVNKYPNNYAQYWIHDIEQVLGQTLGGAGTIRVYEVLENESISTRKYGWDVRAGAGMVANNFAGDSGNPLMTIEGNYYQPISDKAQLSSEARLVAQLDDDDSSYNFSNTLGLTYELSDRIDWQNSWNLNYQNNESGQDVTRNTLSSEFAYAISNAVDYTTSLSLAHVDYEDSDSSFDKALYMGVKYRLK